MAVDEAKVNDYMYEEVEEPEEKGIIEKLGKNIDDAIKESPVCMGMVAGLNKTIEDLKIENKNLQAKIDYLRGQISVYERYLDVKKEEN